MVNQTENLISKIQELFSEIRYEKGPFYLFMVLKMDEYIDKWSVAISAPWLGEVLEKEGHKYFFDKFAAKLSKEEITTIARFGFFRPTENLVSLVTSSFNVSGPKPTHLEDLSFSGFVIYDAYIFESKKNLDE